MLRRTLKRTSEILAVKQEVEEQSETSCKKVKRETPDRAIGKDSSPLTVNVDRKARSNATINESNAQSSQRYITVEPVEENRDASTQSANPGRLYSNGLSRPSQGWRAEVTAKAHNPRSRSFHQSDRRRQNDLSKRARSHGRSARKAQNRREVDFPHMTRPRCKCADLPQYFMDEFLDYPTLQGFQGNWLEFITHVGQIASCQGYSQGLIDSCRLILANEQRADRVSTRYFYRFISLR